MDDFQGVNRSGPPNICPSCGNDDAGTFQWHGKIIPERDEIDRLRQTDTFTCDRCGRYRVFLPPAYGAVFCPIT